MSRETLFTSARRLERFIRIDDERHGGLLNIETIKANMIVENMLRVPRYERESTVAEISERKGEWFVRFDTSIEFVSFGRERPKLEVGEKVDIIIRKQG